MILSPTSFFTQINGPLGQICLHRPQPVHLSLSTVIVSIRTDYGLYQINIYPLWCNEITKSQYIPVMIDYSFPVCAFHLAVRDSFYITDGITKILKILILVQ